MQITLAYLNSLSKAMNNQQLSLKSTQSRGKGLQSRRSKTFKRGRGERQEEKLQKISIID